MVLTPSTMLPIGTQAPSFRLPEVVTGKTISLDNFTNKKGLLVMFICQHCPFVKHVKAELANLGKDYLAQDLGIVAISANDVANYPDALKEATCALLYNEKLINIFVTIVLKQTHAFDS